MATKFLMTMKLTKQGTIKGSSKPKGGPLDYSKGLECHGFSYEVVTQIDPASGQLIGKRKHNPITIVREVDSASPLLWSALCTNEAFTSAKLQFDNIGPNGKPTAVHTIELTNGSIVGIRQLLGVGGKRSEAVTLAYDGLLVNGAPGATIPLQALTVWRP